jgi:hypothetical protein
LDVAAIDNGIDSVQRSDVFILEVVFIFVLSFVLPCFSLILPMTLVFPLRSLGLPFSVVPFFSFIVVSVLLLFLVTLIFTILILLTAR